MKVLVTGAEGFVGGHLLPHLRERGHTVVASSYDGSVGELLRLPNDAGCDELVADTRPDAIIHLAAVSAVGEAEKEPEHAYSVNVWGTRALVKAAGALDQPCHFLFISTSAVYGPVAEDQQPLNEDLPARPVQVYAMTKLAAESVLHAFPQSMAPQLRWNILRPFNHTGPGQRSDFVMSSFARQVAEAEVSGAGSIVRVGNLGVRRDFLDVRDVVEAYVRVLESNSSRGVYNVCRGEAFRLADMVDTLRQRARVPVRFEVDPGRLRSTDIEVMVGDASRLSAATGWQARIPIENTLRDLLDYWRRRLSGGQEPSS